MYEFVTRMILIVLLQIDITSASTLHGIIKNVSIRQIAFIFLLGLCVCVNVCCYYYVLKECSLFLSLYMIPRACSCYTFFFTCLLSWLLRMDSFPSIVFGPDSVYLSNYLWIDPFVKILFITLVCHLSQACVCLHIFIHVILAHSYIYPYSFRVITSI